MQDAVMYLGSCVLGYFAGLPLRKLRARMGWLDPAQNILVLLLIFAMGLRVGSNEEAVRNIGSYGIYALAFTAVVLLFSMLSVSLIRRLLGYDRYGEKHGKGAAPKRSEDSYAVSGTGSNTLKMVGLVSVGIALSYWLVRSGRVEAETLGSGAGTFITVGLCALLVMIGLSLGLEGKIASDIRSAGQVAFILPLAVAVGTFAGSALCSLFLPLSLRECFAIGSGFGWYSLSSGIILDAGYVAAGTISFMHNVMRELFSVILIPIVAAKCGWLEALGLPGSTAMDVCLPVAARATNARIGICSFVTGFLLSLAVPFVVPLFL